MDYLTITLVPIDSHWSISLGSRRVVPGRRLPVTLRKPWQHHYQIPQTVTADQIFQAVEQALLSLAAEHQ